ncbi:hypothetical protein AB0M28_15950 [Streptomyces sp. NPDC051940]|uniref:hypothetical protein n=1 Tax=Streptomyces sp. NPDC051940 TaxID=3155675 RepID=UPI00341BE1A5
MTRDPEIKKELNATLHARRELGPEYEDELVDGFLEKVQDRIDGSIDQRMRRQAAEQQMVVARGTGTPARSGDSTYAERYGFATVTMVLAVPLSAIGAGTEGLSGLLVAWAGIVGVNALHVGWRWPRRADRKKSESDWD